MKLHRTMGTREEIEKCERLLDSVPVDDLEKLTEGRILLRVQYGMELFNEAKAGRLLRRRQSDKIARGHIRLVGQIGNITVFSRPNDPEPTQMIDDIAFDETWETPEEQQ